LEEKETARAEKAIRRKRDRQTDRQTDRQMRQRETEDAKRNKKRE
jgi:hypothetical protein